MAAPAARRSRGRLAAGGRWRWVVAGFAVFAVLVITLVGMLAGTLSRPAPSLQTCEHYLDLWGPGLASAQGLQMDRAVIAVAIANGSFDVPTDIPRDDLRQAYQTGSPQPVGPR
ncbi:hypothetical protein Acsp06_65170 [Actinomycetospora sp. NBRC 106375]|uniref:hypothetical protein n=1 Tax=Actinomycetospora sp. NBRC 106375 TaxID=3032207 RepID=UPI0024A2DCB0|nr:hypothetical protein [Actinomycetospora sp. NBRC 106375]GLZ50332.1 hypothetical protein Acsp06_65170 [Actinomycetospora sp. NBRC 106375]